MLADRPEQVAHRLHRRELGNLELAGVQIAGYPLIPHRAIYHGQFDAPKSNARHDDRFKNRHTNPSPSGAPSRLCSHNIHPEQTTNKNCSKIEQGTAHAFARRGLRPHTIHTPDRVCMSFRSDSVRSIWRTTATPYHVKQLHLMAPPPARTMRIDVINGNALMGD